MPRVSHSPVCAKVSMPQGEVATTLNAPKALDGRSQPSNNSVARMNGAPRTGSWCESPHDMNERAGSCRHYSRLEPYHYRVRWGRKGNDLPWKRSD
jgi:hypothetical protein